MIRALGAALALALAFPGGASAHAVLKTSVPERGAALESAPAQVELVFNEPVEAAFGSVKVFAADGSRADQGPAFRPEGDSKRVAMRLKPGLPEGGYTATFRVISADGHPVSGGFVFGVGEGAAPSASVDELLEGGEAGPVTSAAFGAARAVQFAAIALALGVAAFLWLCWLPALRETTGAGGAWGGASEAFAARMRRLLALAAAAGAVSGLAALGLQGATGAGTSFWSALTADVLGDVAGTRFGTAWAAGVVAWLAILAIRRPGPLLAIPLAALVAMPSFGGHAGVQAPVALLLPTNILHVLAIGAWAGGIAVLVLALRSATRALEEDADRTRLLAANVARFSALATVAIPVVLLTGVVQSIVYLESFGQLLDTAFGRALLVKIALFAGIVALGWLNRSRLLPALRRAAGGGETAGRTGIVLRRALRAELAIAVAVFAATGALASYAPSSAVSAGPFSARADLGPAKLELTVDPARVGANEMHVYLFDRRTGAQWDRADELTIEAELPGKGIEPIDLAAEKSGPGHYVVPGAAFGVAGDWKLTVSARVGEFDLHQARFDLPIE